MRKRLYQEYCFGKNIGSMFIIDAFQFKSRNEPVETTTNFCITPFKGQIWLFPNLEYLFVRFNRFFTLSRSPQHKKDILKHIMLFVEKFLYFKPYYGLIKPLKGKEACFIKIVDGISSPFFRQYFPHLFAHSCTFWESRERKFVFIKVCAVSSYFISRISMIYPFRKFCGEPFNTILSYVPKMLHRLRNIGFKVYFKSVIFNQFHWIFRGLTFSLIHSMIRTPRENGGAGIDSPSRPRRPARHPFDVRVLWLGAAGGVRPCRVLCRGLSTRCCPATPVDSGGPGGTNLGDMS